MVHFWGDGIAQSLFSKFTAYQSLESSCIGLIGRKLYCFSGMPIQFAATNRLHYRPPCSFNNEYWLSVYQITTKNIYCRRKCQNMRENMRYAHFAKICEKCGKVPNMPQSHIRVFLTCLVGDPCVALGGDEQTAFKEWMSSVLPLPDGVPVGIWVRGKVVWGRYVGLLETLTNARALFD